ncbi:hypothetical protein D3C73_987430 [compost metagenome]
MLLGRQDFQPAAARAPDQDGPAAALDFIRRFAELRLEGIIAAEAALNGIKQRSSWASAALRRHDVPEEGVQIMARPVKGQFPFPMLHEVEIAVFTGFFQLGLSFVQPVDITLVVFVMMDDHRLFVNIRLQGIVGIRQQRKGMSAYRHDAGFTGIRRQFRVIRSRR